MGNGKLNPRVTVMASCACVAEMRLWVWLRLLRVLVRLSSVVAVQRPSGAPTALSEAAA